MNIAIFGASGATGRLLTEHCLAAGHHVSALVRNPDDFPFRDQVRVVQDPGFKHARVRQVVEHADAVLSALGARTLARDEVIERGLPVILRAMHSVGVRRIVVLGAAGAKPGSLIRQPAPVRWIVQHVVYDNVLRWPMRSQQFQYETLSASDVDWTMVLPPKLRNTRGRRTYRVDTQALPPGASQISRADVADFMIAQLTHSEYSRQAVYIAW